LLPILVIQDQDSNCITILFNLTKHSYSYGYTDQLTVITEDFQTVKAHVSNGHAASNFACNKYFLGSSSVYLIKTYLKNLSRTQYVSFDIFDSTVFCKCYNEYKCINRTALCENYYCIWRQRHFLVEMFACLHWTVLYITDSAQQDIVFSVSDTVCSLNNGVSRRTRCPGVPLN
jgi:hypothetical protein